MTTPPPPLSTSRRRHETARLGRDRWEVAGIFALGSVCGMLLWQCTPSGQPKTARECQALVLAPWLTRDGLAKRSQVLAGDPLSHDATHDATRQLVVDLRRCSGLDTVFLDDLAPLNDPFGVTPFLAPWPKASIPDAGTLLRSD